MEIGIVGDIGSGKTYISRKFNYPVFNADEEIKKIYEKNYRCFLKLKKKFPKQITKFPISKNELSKLILKNGENLKEIGKVVHPYVSKNLKLFLSKNKNKKNVVLDIPLLIENKISTKNLILIFVETKKKEILKRLKKRPNFNKKLFNLIKKNQIALKLKKKKCKFVIKNNFNKVSLKKSISEIKKKLDKYD